MSESQWWTIQDLFLSAVDLEPLARDAFLKSAAIESDAVRNEVESLLRAASAPEDILEGTVRTVAQDFAARIATSRVGERVGAYRLIDVIGHGGMGTVYLAERADDAYRARVAIKFVRGAHAAPELARRFLAERQILADLNHPGIARLIDGGSTIDGTPYLVLEYVEGVHIDTWCDAHALQVRERIALILKVCDAVQHAHDARIVHRDLKPSNILVPEDGSPKLVDFGIARLLSESGAETSVFRVLTPAYASPEQVRGETVTVASDVYSLGGLLYKILAGRTPFDLTGATAGEIERRVTKELPLPVSRAATQRDAQWRETVAGGLDAIIAKSLAKRIDQRYASVSALATDLRTWLATPDDHGLRRHWNRIRNSRRVRVGALAAVAAAATALTWRTIAARREVPIGFRFLPVQVMNSPISAPFRVVKADLNGDGRGDLVWSHAGPTGHQVAIGLGQSDGTIVMQSAPMTAPAGVDSSYRLFVGDFNGDGRDELLWNRVGFALPNLTVVGFSNEDGSFRYTEPFTHGPPGLRWGNGWETLVGDLDGDGSDDLVFNFLSTNNLIRVWRSLGDGTFVAQVEMSHFGQRWAGYRAFVADVTGDQRADIFWNDVPVWANRIYIARSQGDRLDLLSAQDHEVKDGWSGFTTTVADFDGDGASDMIWTKSSGDSITAFLARGQQTAMMRYLPVQHLRLPQGAQLTSGVIGDFNGDRRADLAWHSAGGMWALPGHRAGRFGLEAVPGSESAPDEARQNWIGFDVVANDVNGDGRDDLVWIDRSGARLYVAVAAPPRS